MSFNLDGSKVAAGGEEDNLVHIADTASGKIISTLDAQSAKVWTTAASPDGKLLASGSEDGMILLWDFASLEQGSSLRGSHKGSIESLAFNQDGDMLASLGSGVAWTRSGGQISVARVEGDRYVRLWDLTSGKESGSIKTASEIVGISFSTDWSLAVTGEMDGVI